MSSEATGYTAAQYLEAGFREESKGDRERAHQYYAYVAEAFPDSPEAEAAKGGLMRLGFLTAEPPYSGALGAPGPADRNAGPPAGPSGPVGGGNVRPAHGGNGAATNGVAGGWQMAPSPRTGPPAEHPGPHTQPPRSRPAAATPPAANPGAYAPPPGQRIALGELARLKFNTPAEGQQSPGAHHGHAPKQPNGPHHDAALQGGDHGDGMRLPEVVARRQRELAEGEAYAPSRRRYRSGRVMAWIFIVFGWLSIAGGIAAIVLGLAMGGGGMGVALGPAAGLGAIISGLMMAMIGQLALAVFDNTEAVRELTWHVRSRGDL